MKKRIFFSFLLTLAIYAFVPLTISNGQTGDTKPVKKNKEEKKAEQGVIFTRIDSLVKSQQFVFKADFGPRSDEIFVVVDSSYAMVQNGNRNNLEGRVTKCEIKSNEKSKTISVTLMMWGALYTADVFIFIGAAGSGKATIKSEFPGYFIFDGYVVDFENANIYDGGSIFVH